jgi:pimeloyl-ACP methyl ester carboxylesterase
VNDLQLFYVEQGRGEAVVFIPGLGGDHHLWHHQLPAFAQHFRAIALDPRGAGQSDKPDLPYTIEEMADDVAGLLEALGIERAHVVGASMGGFIAQMFALRHPHRLGRLILCCTSFGGPNVVPMPPESLAVFTQRTGDPATDLRRLWAVSVTERFLREHPEVLEEYVAWRVAHPQPLYAYQRQLAAALAFQWKAASTRSKPPSSSPMGWKIVWSRWRTPDGCTRASRAAVWSSFRRRVISSSLSGRRSSTAWPSPS